MVRTSSATGGVPALDLFYIFLGLLAEEWQKTPRNSSSQNAEL
ncbi:MAG TPA: hypothetical protein VGF24_03365 [Vicinamibacterales bacterium]|jgi:hypothetical protein